LHNLTYRQCPVLHFEEVAVVLSIY
jgi:hypothetical protein